MLMNNFFTLKFIKKILFQKKLYLYGAASSGVKAALLLQSLGFIKKNLFFIDSNYKKVGKIIYGIKVISLDLVNKSSCVIITSSIFYEIEKILKNKKFTNFYYFHDLIWTNFLEPKFTNNFINIYEKIKKNIYLSMDEAFTLYDNLYRILNIKKINRAKTRESVKKGERGGVWRDAKVILLKLGFIKEAAPFYYVN